MPAAASEKDPPAGRAFFFVSRQATAPAHRGLWLEIKHDGFRVVARMNGTRVKLYSRPGNDLTYRFMLIVESLAHLRSPACIIDGEAVCCDDDSGPAGARRATRLQRSLRRPLYS